MTNCIDISRIPFKEMCWEGWTALILLFIVGMFAGIMLWDWFCGGHNRKVLGQNGKTK